MWLLNWVLGNYSSYFRIKDLKYLWKKDYRNKIYFGFHPNKFLFVEESHVNSKQTSKELRAVTQSDTCILTFTVVLFTTAKGGNNSRIHQQISKQNMVYTYDGILFSQKTQNEVPISATRWLRRYLIVAPFCSFYGLWQFH